MLSDFISFSENRKLKEEIAKLKRFSPNDSDTEFKIISLKCLKRRKLKSKKIARTNKGKRVFGNNLKEEDTKSDNEKNEKGTKISNSVSIQNVVLILTTTKYLLVRIIAKFIVN
ncbi:hypothetical protein Glove_303g43 [Diversispora epigaea]|uniref:Uncharacterized protein n=1 Tax=Diversispora epigaea TaxID=1348612 RepID=A0A397HZU3_9GLOM|nr:hypothetical protein Glove_303g43 [Diversispora epigaea]